MNNAKKCKKTLYKWIKEARLKIFQTTSWIESKERSDLSNLISKYYIQVETNPHVTYIVIPE